MTTERKVHAGSVIRNLFYGAAIIFILVVVFNLFSYSSTKTKSAHDISYQQEILSHGYYAVPTPDSLYFAGERVPLENFDVRESLDMELHKVSYWHSELFLYLKRANRFFPVIEPILKKNGIPDDFKYVCVAESGLTNAVSPAKAEGFWQFMEPTAKSYGLEVNDEVDERYHVKKATEAACKYLKAKYRKFGTWTLAAASYNAGDGGVNRFMEYQDEESYYDLALYEETARYVYRALAMKVIMEHPQQFGFHYRQKDLYPVIDTKEVEVDTAITDLAAFAKSQGTNYKLIKLLNPWLRDRKLKNKNKKTYYIAVPTEGARTKNYFPEEEKEVIKEEPVIEEKASTEKKVEDSSVSN